MATLAPEIEQQINAIDTSFSNPFGITETDRVAAKGKHPDDIEVMLGYALMQGKASGPEQVLAMVDTHGESSTRGPQDFVRNYGRIQETVNGLGSLGVKLKKIYMPGIPDEELSSKESYSALVDRTARFIAVNGITVLITLGRDGGDGNPEHINSHRAAVEAVRSLGSDTRIFGLNAHGTGEVFVPGDDQMLRRKMGATAANRSQFPMYVQTNGGTLPAGWERIGGYDVPPETLPHLRIYNQYLQSETYDRF